MTLLEEAKAHVEKMREHTDCCGMPIFRRMVAELERLTPQPGRLPDAIRYGPRDALPLTGCIHCRCVPCMCAVAQVNR